MTVITGWRIAQELLEALMAIGLATIIAGTTYVIATEALEYLDQENYDYWRARRSSGSVWIGPGISFATAVILLTDARRCLGQNTWSSTNCLHQCISKWGGTWPLYSPQRLRRLLLPLSSNCICNWHRRI